MILISGLTHICTYFNIYWSIFVLGNLCDSVVKNLPAQARDTSMQIWFLGQEDPLEKEMAIHSSILARKCCGQRSLEGSMESQRVGHDWAMEPSHTHTHTHTHTNTHTHICIKLNIFMLGLTQCLSGRKFTYNAGDTGDEVSIPGSGRFPWRRAWPPTPALLLGKSQGQRSLGGYGP